MTRYDMLAGGVALLGLMLGCAAPPPPDTRAADEQAIREAEIEFSKAMVAKDIERHMSFYADDTSLFLPGAPVAAGKDAIRKLAEGFYALPGLSFSFQTVKVEVARSGDLAYSHGTYAMTMNDPKGKPVSDKGKYVTVWKKQPDGKWKAVADIFNSDLPPAPPKK